MSAEKEILQQITLLKSRLDSYEEYNFHNDKMLWQKLRLEWNYNSNHIEGNTLTYGETMLLLIKGQTIQEHNIREFDEMRAHDLVIEKVRQAALEHKHPLTESDIRTWNEIILVKPFWKDSITADGIPTKKRIVPGKYKELPNHVLLHTGEVFYFAEPQEVAPKMAALLEWYKNHSKELHPLEIASLLHYRFVRIHPFDDGNGRIARLLMNFVLMRKGYPPVIIRSAEKNDYLNALSKADAGDMDTFIDFVGKQLVWSLELTLKRAEGQPIVEEEDWLKELDLIKKRLEVEHLSRRPEKTIELVGERLEDSILPLFEKVRHVIQQFGVLFEKQEERILLQRESMTLVYTGNYPVSPLELSRIIMNKQISGLALESNLVYYRMLENETTFSVDKTIVMALEKFGYTISIKKSSIGLPLKSWDVSLTEKEIKGIANKTGQQILKQIRELSGEQLQE